MIKIMFVCHGNICRSPMAEHVFRHMVEKKGISNKFHIASSATSTEEIGNSVHHGTKRKLREEGISCEGKYAVQLTQKDYKDYDYILCMDSNNLRNTMKIIGKDEEKKVCRLLDYSDKPRDIADPWYTGNFEITYQDVLEGCEVLLKHILKE